MARESIGGDKRKFWGWPEKVLGVARKSFGGGERKYCAAERERVLGC